MDTVVLILEWIAVIPIVLGAIFLFGWIGEHIFGFGSSDGYGGY